MGWFFVPVMSFFKPYQVLKEIWKYSDPAYRAGTGYRTRKAIIGWWLFLFWLYELGGRVSAEILFKEETLQATVTGTYFSISTDVIAIASMILTILIVRSVTEMQETKRSRTHVAGTVEARGWGE